VAVVITYLISHTASIFAV